MEKSQVEEGRTYLARSGTRHFVRDVVGQRVLYEAVSAHGFFIEDQPIVEASLGRFAAQHEPV